MDYIVTCDGGSLNNQGAEKFGYGSYQIEVNGKIYGPYRHEFGNATNNEAEYKALLKALRHVAYYAPVGASVEVRTDSQLVVGQVTQGWKVKAANLQPLVDAAKEMVRDLGGNVTFVKIPGDAMKAILGH